MSMRISVFALASVVLLAQKPSHLDVQPQTSAVTLLLMTGFGEPTDGDIIFTPISGGPPQRFKVQSVLSAQIQYGRYVVTVENRFLRPQKRDVVVDRPRMVLPFATRLSDLNMDYGGDASVSLSLRVTVPKTCGKQTLWARVIGMYSDYTNTVVFSEGGFALSDPMEVGEYLVLFYENTALRATKIVKCIGKLTVAEITFSDCGAGH